MGDTSLQSKHLSIANSSSETTRFSFKSSEYSSELAVRRHWGVPDRLTLQSDGEDEHPLGGASVM